MFCCSSFFFFCLGRVSALVSCTVASDSSKVGHLFSRSCILVTPLSSLTGFPQRSKKSNMSEKAAPPAALLDEVAKGATGLKPTTTVDKSKPVVKTADDDKAEKVIGN